MPRMTVRGVCRSYKVVDSAGPWVTLTLGGQHEK